MKKKKRRDLSETKKSDFSEVGFFTESHSVQPRLQIEGRGGGRGVRNSHVYYFLFMCWWLQGEATFSHISLTALFILIKNKNSLSECPKNHLLLFFQKQGLIPVRNASFLVHFLVVWLNYEVGCSCAAYSIYIVLMIFSMEASMRPKVFINRVFTELCRSVSAV